MKYRDREGFESRMMGRKANTIIIEKGNSL